MKRRNLFAALLFLFPPPLRGNRGLPPGLTRGVRVGGASPPPLASFPPARTLGAAYLRAYPDDPLTTILADDVAARVRDDFADGRVVVLNGWMLSITEARLCALAVRAV